MLDYMKQCEWLAIIFRLSPVLALALSSLISISLSSFSRGRAGKLYPAISFAGMAVAFMLSWFLWAYFDGGIFFGFVFDRITAIGWIVLCLISIFILLISMSSKNRASAYTPEYSSLVLFLTAGLMIVVAGNDFLNIFMGMVVVVSAISGMISIFGSSSRYVESQVKAYLSLGLSLVFLMMGSAFVFGAMGTLDFQTISGRASEISHVLERVFFTFGIAMSLIAYAMAIFIMPFGSWFIDSSDGSPSPISAYLSTSVLVAFAISFMRFVFAFIGSFDMMWHNVITIFSIATMLFGFFGAMRQDDLKRMLAYSTVCHAGFVLALFASPAIAGQIVESALLMYVVPYSMVMIGFFAAIVFFEGSGDGGVEINRLAGLSKRNPYIAAAISFLLFSLAGIPPAVGFWSKLFLIRALITSGSMALGIAVSIVSAGLLYVYMRPVSIMYFRRLGELKIEEGRSDVASMSLSVVTVLSLMILFAIFFGIFPNNLIAFVLASS